MQNKKRYNAFVRSNLVNLCLFFVTLDTLFVQTFAADKKYVLENSFMKRVIEVKGDKLSTKSIVNKLAKTTAKPTSCDEFRLRISEGTEKIGTDVTLVSNDFTVTSSREYGKNARCVEVTLHNVKYDITVKIRYEITDKKFYAHKYLMITATRAITLERVDVETMAFDDAWQPYKLKCINARGKWSPGLGQPLYTTKSGTFWGVEFPAAYNFVTDKIINCGYLWGRKLTPGKAYVSYKAVVGVSDDPKFNTDAFFKYVNEIRVRPLRLQIQYNSWFDFKGRVKKESFAKSVKTIHNELVVKRGCKPLKAYVIDDGWQYVADTPKFYEKAWQTNKKFDKDFKSSFQVTNLSQSHLGLWMSPGSLFGAKRMIPLYKKARFETLSSSMSLAGPKYMDFLENRMVELTKMGITYFKLDGLFGHLLTRNFELHGEKYALPSMPQLKVGKLRSDDKRLNSSKYDEMKTYYLVAGSERLIQMFKNMSIANPNVYVVISNGAYLSPWWLMYVDSCWMIMAGDAARGADRTGELVYRDGIYYEIVKKEKTQFPICALFNHEPKKVKTRESKESFRKYLYMSVSRGTGFIELYLKTPKLSEADWDVLAEGLHWAYEIFPTFARSRMYGGNPRKKEVYGYTAWTIEQGYLSVHNPSNKRLKWSVTLDRSFGLMKNSGKYFLSSPVAKWTRGLKKEYSYGDTISLELEPKEIRVLNFDKTVRNWSKLRRLQTMNPEVPKNLKGRKKHR